MNYIVLDLEFNQNFESLSTKAPILTRYPFEIVQIGAIKLNNKMKILASFDRLVKPSIFLRMNPEVSNLTGISTKSLQDADPFPVVYKEFLDFIKDPDSIFCIWGMSDIRELYKNAIYHQLDDSLLPNQYINLQPLASMYLKLSPKKLMRLQTTVETLEIPVYGAYHNAYNDAYYTAMIWRKIFHPSIQPQIYHPNQVLIKQRQQKKVLNLSRLIQQFEKMYQRTFSEEEQNMIKLAYHMGKTGQFLEQVEVKNKEEEESSKNFSIS